MLRMELFLRITRILMVKIFGNKYFQYSLGYYKNFLVKYRPDNSLL